MNNRWWCTVKRPLSQTSGTSVDSDDGKKRRLAGRVSKIGEMHLCLIGDSQWGQITMSNQLMKVAWDKGREVRLWTGGKIWQIAKMVSEVDSNTPKVVVSLGRNDLADMGAQSKRGAAVRVRAIVAEAMKLIRKLVRLGYQIGIRYYYHSQGWMWWRKTGGFSTKS